MSAVRPRRLSIVLPLIIALIQVPIIARNWPAVREGGPYVGAMVMQLLFVLAAAAIFAGCAALIIHKARNSR